MKRKAVVTGMGVNSCAGNTVQEFYGFLNHPPKNQLFIQDNPFNLDIEIKYGKADSLAFTLPETGIEFDNPTSQLCLSSATEALNNAFKNGLTKKPDTLIVGTSTGGQKLCEDFVCSHLNHDKINLNYTAQGNMASVSRCIARELGLKCRIQTVSTACTSSANAIALGAMFIESNKSNIALVGGGDAICRTTLSGFRILGLTGLNPCKPFGPNRLGMSLGEGSAFLILEEKNRGLNEGRSYLTEVLGYGFSSDAYSMTSPSQNGEGATFAMKNALKKANLDTQEIGFVNAHGTGTEFNDKSEAIAISGLFNENQPVSSLKGLTGHTLGAAGAIEAVASIYTLETKHIFPNFYSYENGEDCPVNLTPEKGLTLENGKAVLSNSFAFGGNNCTLIFSGME